MVKLLIADDEIFTLEGIIDSLPWEELGITTIEQAHNGVKAYELACRMNADILLTDVRMPRMDGIELAFKYREVNPECKIIFMSGYSDKEYLKSAIRLKAVNYIEKPIILTELREALENAVAMCASYQKAKENEQTTSQVLSASLPLLQSELALRLMNKAVTPEEIQELVGLTGLTVSSETCFVTVLIKGIQPDASDSGFASFSAQNGLIPLPDLLAANGLNGISAIKDSLHLVVHLLLKVEGNCRLNSSVIGNFCQAFIDHVQTPVQISVGKPVKGPLQVYESYNTAVLAMERIFYSAESPVFYSENFCQPYKVNECIFDEFNTCLENYERDKLIYLVKNLSSSIRHYDNTLVNYVKDIYFRLLLQLVTHAESRGIELFEDNSGADYLWRIISRQSTLDAVEKVLTGKIHDYFSAYSQLNAFGGIVGSIIKYIRLNYKHEELSINQISDHLVLTPSYICKVFKEETGKTINQYITEYRLDRAKELLRDRMLKVSDIASQVGYSDGNYFAKLFRKSTGLNPSEFRERFLL